MNEGTKYNQELLTRGTARHKVGNPSAGEGDKGVMVKLLLKKAVFGGRELRDCECHAIKEGKKKKKGNRDRRLRLLGDE